MNDNVITLAHGSGGKEMNELIRGFGFSNRGRWKNFDSDSATYDLGNGKFLAFTTDSFVVSPLFFPGGNIGSLAFSGTVNDLAVIGAEPIGISLSTVIEEGFSAGDLRLIIETINKLSSEYNIPIATGDTKVMEKGKIDSIVINTSGVGIADSLLDKRIIAGDKVIISGGIGEHAVALLSKRFSFETCIETDSKPVINEVKAVKRLIKAAKDPTRGGIASALNEICIRNKVGMILYEDKIPAKDEVRQVTEMFGINLYELACEGRFVCIAAKENAPEVENILKKFNKDASIIGEITGDERVVVQTILGKRVLPMPSGRIVPRIC